jgi:hypothetical protein
MALFGNKKVKETTVKDCIKMVEAFLQKCGANPKKHRLPDKDTIGWQIARGSAIIYILINNHEGLTTIRVISPILTLPKSNILPFYRKCLEINTGLISCALGAYEDKVAVLSERPIEGLDPEELEGILNHLSAVADDLDNKLADEFGATIFSESMV